MIQFYLDSTTTMFRSFRMCKVYASLFYGIYSNKFSYWTLSHDRISEIGKRPYLGNHNNNENAIFSRWKNSLKKNLDLP